VRLGEVCDVVRGSSPRPKSDPRFYGGTVPRLMVADLTRDGKVVSARIDTLTELGAKQSRPMTRGDVVIAVSGAPGLPAILAHDACIHDGFVGLRDLDGSRLDAEFLYAYLTFVRATNNSQAVGAIFKNLTTDQIKGIEIPELPLAEQRRIAEVLDRAEALRAKRRAALAQLDSLTQSLFLDLFGDPINNPMGWDTLPFESQIESVRYGTGSPPDYVDDGIPFIRATNIKGGAVLPKDLKRISLADAKRISQCQVSAGDLIVVRSGVNTGDAAVVPEELDGAYAAYDLIVRLNEMSAVFYNFLINSSQGKTILSRLTRRAAQAHLNADQLRKIEFIAPRVELRKEFARRVRAVEKLKTTQRASLAELDALFATLQHRAFRGGL
jgi:type I restriction enzyme, S subunit